MSSSDLERLFDLLTGYPSFPWQRSLLQRLVAGEFPASASLPTGLGKTTVIVLWLIACYAALRQGRKNFPRRLYFVINRRTVVDEATAFADRIRRRIEAADEPELADMKKTFSDAAAFDENGCIGLTTLRGEFADNEEWRVDPARPSIVIGTIDKIGSKLLFAGYGDSHYSRPTAASLTAISSYVVYDEAHLEPAFGVLLESIKQFIAQEPTSLGSFHFTELTATPRDDSGFQLTQDDYQDATVRQRINASKSLNIIPDQDDLVGTITAQALHFKDRSEKIIVYVNSPEDAFQIFAELNGDKSVAGRAALLTGTIRGFERDQLDQHSSYSLFLRSDESVNATIYLVSTSAGEVGADFDANHLITEGTTLDALIQRLGRLNRRGRSPEARAIFVINTKKLASEKEDAEKNGRF
jgi:CRISPR-associated endonuclease/helicase Cas3